jgi:hypothetical protein
LASSVLSKSLGQGPGCGSDLVDAHFVRSEQLGGSARKLGAEHQAAGDRAHAVQVEELQEA